MSLITITRAALIPAARAYFRPSVAGRHHVPRTGPVILAANHLSVLDSLVIPLFAPRPVAFLAKAEYFRRGRVSRPLFLALDAIPVERDGFRTAQASLDQALGWLRDGGAFGIHPEGTRSRDGRLYRGRAGVGWLALASGAPVVPVAVGGTGRALPVGATLPRPRRISIRFGAPLTFPAGGGALARRRATDEVMDAIGVLSGQEQARAYAHRPE